MATIEYPKELNIVFNDKNIEFELDDPNKITPEIQQFMVNIQKAQENSAFLIVQKKFKISGKTAECRLNYLNILLCKLGYEIPGIFIYPLKQLMAMDPRITPTMTQKEVEALPGFPINEIQSIIPDPKNPTLDQLSKCPVEVGPCTAAFILAYFTKEAEVDKMNKTYGDEKEGPWSIRLTMPITFPASIQHNFETNTYTFKFGDFGSTTAEVYQKIFTYVINNLTKLYCLKGELTDADETDPIESKDIADKYNLYVACYQDLETIDDELATSHIYLFSKKEEKDILEEEKDILEKAMNEIFDHNKVWKCKKCGMVYSPVKEKDCLLFIHEGDRIPFSDGEMSAYDDEEEDDDGKPLKLYNYTCCGAVPYNEQGCKQKENGQHEKDETAGEISRLSTTPGFQYEIKY